MISILELLTKTNRISYVSQFHHYIEGLEEFSKCMHSEFEMSMMGELNFFLGLQIKQLKEGTFINHAKYIRDLLKRFNMEEAKTMKKLKQ